MRWSKRLYDGLRLSKIEKRVLRHQISSNFTGTNIRIDGRLINGNLVSLNDEVALDSETLSQLFMLPNDSNAQIEIERFKTDDGAPPGVYIRNHHRFIRADQFNRVGIYKNVGHKKGMFLEGVFIDHIFFDSTAPTNLGTVGFFLLALTAYRLDFAEITLLAGGGTPVHAHRWGIPGMVGFKVWPKFGFDAELEPNETSAVPGLSNCRTVQDVRKKNLDWWENVGGNGRVMRFDLSPHSKSWRILLDYVRGKKEFK